MFILHTGMKLREKEFRDNLVKDSQFPLHPELIFLNFQEQSNWKKNLR